VPWCKSFCFFFQKEALPLGWGPFPKLFCAPHHFVLEPKRRSRYLLFAAVQQKGENTWLT
jgi:hypothetical protein